MTKRLLAEQLVRSAEEKDLDEMSEHISSIANLCRDPNNCIGCTLQFCNKEETKRFLSQKI
jgi:hypothetical protein